MSLCSIHIYGNFLNPFVGFIQCVSTIFSTISIGLPLPTKQGYTYRQSNTIDNKLIAKQYSDRVVNLLINCPQLVDLYSKEITSILRNELFNGNIDLVKGIINNFQGKEFIKEIQSILIVMNMSVGSKKETITTESDEYEQRTQEEQQIVTGQQKTSKFRPIISETVKKSVILHDDKQKLHEMKEQLLNYQEQQSVNQETEYEEESHGMSM